MESMEGWTRFTNLPHSYQAYAIKMECKNELGTCAWQANVGIENGKLIVWVAEDEIRMCWGAQSPPPHMLPPGTFPDAQPRWHRG
jgi:hypothetical protein